MVAKKPVVPWASRSLSMRSKASTTGVPANSLPPLPYICRSIKPGATKAPFKSILVTPSGMEVSSVMAIILPPVIKITLLGLMLPSVMSWRLWRAVIMVVISVCVYVLWFRRYRTFNAGRCPALTYVSLSGKVIQGRTQNLIPRRGYICQRWASPIVR